MGVACLFQAWQECLNSSVTSNQAPLQHPIMHAKVHRRWSQHSSHNLYAYIQTMDLSISASRHVLLCWKSCGRTTQGPATVCVHYVQCMFLVTGAVGVQELGASFKVGDIPADLVDEAQEWHEKLLEQVVEMDDDAMEKYLDVCLLTPTALPA